MTGSYIKDDIQQFMEMTYYMMGIVDEFMDISDASSYGGFRCVCFEKCTKKWTIS